MSAIRYEVIHSENIDFLEGLCNQLMNFQAGGATIHPEIMGSMNYHNRLKPDYAATERKYLLVAYDEARPVGFAFAAIGQVTEASLTGKPSWAAKLDGAGFYPKEYATPKTIGTFKLLYVDEAYRGLAVGKTLTDLTMQWLCANEDAEDLWVYVANGNERVGKLYEKYGFALSHSVYNGFIHAYCRERKTVAAAMDKNAVLLIIDVQQAIDDPSWAVHGARNNPQAEQNMAELLTLWRRAGRRIIHIRHESTNPVSSYRPGQRGCEFKECVRPLADEVVIAKNVNSAFIGTALEITLREWNCSQLVVFGVITNNSVEATVRMAGNLGFSTYLVEDATFTFAKPDYSGQIRTAEEVHAMSLANMSQEYCTVLTTEELKRTIGRSGLGPQTGTE